MPLINHSEPEKIFHGTLTRIHAPKVNFKKKSQDTLRNFSVKPSTPSTPKEPRYLTGTALPNSTVRNSLLQLEANNTLSKDEDIETKKEIESNRKIVQSTDESSSSTVELNLGTSNLRIHELRARHQKLLSSSHDIKDDVTAFEPRRPTMEAIKEAIEKAKQLEVNRHKNVGTTDDFPQKSMSDASTSTDIRNRKGKKKKTSSKINRTDSSTTSSLQTSSTKSKLKKKKVNSDNKKGKVAEKKKP